MHGRRDHLQSRRDNDQRYGPNPWFLNYLIHSFIYLLIPPSVRPFIGALVPSFIRTCIHILLHSVLSSFRYFIHSLNHSFIRFLVRSLIHSFHSFVYSFIHSFTPTSVRQLVRSSIIYILRSYVCTLILSFVRPSFVCSPIHWFILRFIHFSLFFLLSFIHSFTYTLLIHPSEVQTFL